MNDLEIFKKQLSLVNLENAMLGFDQVDCLITHHFAEQTYVREMLMPKDTIVIGKRHRYEGINILLSGKVSVFVGRDKPVQHLEAPAIFVTDPYRKKLLYSHTDVRFCNVHKVDGHDLEEIEKDVIITEEEFQALENPKNKEINI